jgi:hypothetical protein
MEHGGRMSRSKRSALLQVCMDLLNSCILPMLSAFSVFFILC